MQMSDLKLNMIMIIATASVRLLFELSLAFVRVKRCVDFCECIEVQMYCSCYSMTPPRLQRLDFWKSKKSGETLLFRRGLWKSGGHIWNRKPTLGLDSQGDVLAVTLP